MEYLTCIYFENQDFAIKYWRDRGAPLEKLILGFPTYGRTFRLSSGATSVGAPVSGPATAGPYTREAGFWSYYEVNVKHKKQYCMTQLEMNASSEMLKPRHHKLS